MYRNLTNKFNEYKKQFKQNDVEDEILLNKSVYKAEKWYMNICDIDNDISDLTILYNKIKELNKKRDRTFNDDITIDREISNNLLNPSK